MLLSRNILEVIHSISEDRSFTPSQKLAQIARIAKGFAPMLTEILNDYVAQNESSTTSYRVARIEAAKQMLGARSRDG